MAEQKEERHILGLSGGKDSAALALHMREKHPELEIEYFFTDTGSELPEVYDYLNKLEAQLRKTIIHLKATNVRDGQNSTANSSESVFSELFKNSYNGFLPSVHSRWCTVRMKLDPLEKWIAPTLKSGGTVFSYIAIRADEDRLGYKSPNPLMQPKFPFVEDGIDILGVNQILENSGIGKPSYYDWRSRSGCTFCFFQQKIEWVGLLERHPDKFREAVEFEKFSIKTSEATGRKGFTWTNDETLEALACPKRVKKIKEDYEVRKERLKKRKLNVLHEGLEAEDIDIDEVYGHEMDVSVCVTCHK